MQKHATIIGVEYILLHKAEATEFVNVVNDGINQMEGVLMLWAWMDLESNVTINQTGLPMLWMASEEILRDCWYCVTGLDIWNKGKCNIEPNGTTSLEVETSVQLLWKAKEGLLKQKGIHCLQSMKSSWTSDALLLLWSFTSTWATFLSHSLKTHKNSSW